METLLGLLPEIISLAPTVEAAINEGVSLASVASTVQNPAVLDIFTKLGASLFPKAAPELQVAAALVSSYSPSYTKWVQNSCNALLKPPPGLVVDGSYGPKTKAAVEALQAQLGLKVDSWAGDLTSAAIQAALSKLG